MNELAPWRRAAQTVGVSHARAVELPAKSRLSLALCASALAHLTLVLSVVGASATGVPRERERRAETGFRANTVEVGTVPDAVRPSSVERAAGSRAQPAAPLTPERGPAPAEPRISEPPPDARRVTAARNTDAPPVRVNELLASGAQSAPARPARPKPLEPRTSASAVTPGSSDASAATSTGGAGPTSADAGSFGALGLPPGTQYFARAFARALPVVLGDTAWLELPLGDAGEAVLDVRIDEGGRIAEVKLDPTISTPALLKRALDRVFLLLNSGTFSLDGRRVAMGVERLALTAAVSQRQRNPAENANPRLMNEKGHRAPTRERPGSAHLTFNSGRRVEVTIRIRSLDEL